MWQQEGKPDGRRWRAGAGVFNKDGEEDAWSNPVAQALTEATGVRLKIDYPAASQDLKVALMIAEPVRI